MARLAFFAVVLAVLLAHFAAEGDNILHLPSTAQGHNIQQLSCQLQLQQSSLEACRRVVDQQLATQSPFFLSPQALTPNWVQAQCCQQLRDISRECLATAIRQIVSQYEHQAVVPLGGGSFQPSETFPQQPGQGWNLPGQTFPQQPGQGWHLPGQSFPQHPGQGWYLPGQSFPQQPGQGWYLPGQSFPQKPGQGWYLPGQSFPQKPGQGWYLPGQYFPQQPGQGWYLPGQSFPQQPGQGWYLPGQSFPQQPGQGLYIPGQTFPQQPGQGWYFPGQSFPLQQQPGSYCPSQTFPHQQHQGPSSTSEAFPPQQQGELSFGESTMKQQQGSQDPPHVQNGIYIQAVQPTQHEIGETMPHQEVQGQYCGKQTQTGIGGSSSPSISGTDQQAARLKIQLEVVARARQIAAQLPTICRLEVQSVVG